MKTLLSIPLVLCLLAAPAAAQAPDRAAIDRAIAAVYPSLVRISVVVVESRDGRELNLEASGSGTIISADGYVVTNHHVAGRARRIICTLDDKTEVAADLVGTLSGQGKGPFTVFAPTDEAFAKIDTATLQSLLNDPAALRQILLYHVVPGEYPAARVLTSASLSTANGQSLTIRTAGGVRVNDANVTATDIMARNGVIHVIDTVLLPR